MVLIMLDCSAVAMGLVTAFGVYLSPRQENCRENGVVVIKSCITMVLVRIPDIAGD